MNTLYESGATNAARYRDVLPAQVAAIRNQVRVVDVREPDELTGELGHILGVEHAPLATVEAAATGWSKDEEIVLVCRSGVRSGRAAAALTAMGFRRVMNMVGGMLAWNEATLPVERTSA